jgi:hypothetical protein
MKDAYEGSWSIFGPRRAHVIVKSRVASNTRLRDALMRTFENIGAVIKRQNNTDDIGFEFRLPLKQLLRVGYRNSANLSCRVENSVVGNLSESESGVIVVCDIEDLRKQQRFNFYFLSSFALLLVMPRLLAGWDMTSSLFLFLPWLIAQIAYLVDQARLRSKLERILKSVSA